MKNKKTKKLPPKELEKILNKTEFRRSELFIAYLIEKSIISAVFIGVFGGILGNFIYNSLSKHTLYYWLFFIIILLLFLKVLKDTYQKIQYFNKLYKDVDECSKMAKCIQTKAQNATKKS